MFKLVEIFKQEQSDTEVSNAQLDTGSQPPKRAKKSVDKDKKIGELFFVQSPLLRKLVKLVSTILHCFGHILHE